MDKDFKDVRERLRDFEAEVEPQLWENISQRVAKPKHTALTASVIVLSAVLVGFAAMVFFAPKAEKQTVQTALANTSESEIKKDENECPIRADETAFHASECPKEFRETAIQNSELASEPTALLPTTSTSHEKPVQKREETQSQAKNIKPESPTAAANQPTAKPQEAKAESKTLESKTESKDAREEEVIVRQKLFIPNAFTPNGDEKNRIFRPAEAEVRDYRMDIYNGKGARVFTTNEIAYGWDGTFEGESCTQGVYYYILKFTDLKGNPHTQKGSLMLLR